MAIALPVEARDAAGVVGPEVDQVGGRPGREDGEQDESASQDTTTGAPSQDQQEQLQQQQQQADQQARRSRAVDQYIDREDTQFYNGKQW